MLDTPIRIKFVAGRRQFCLSFAAAAIGLFRPLRVGAAMAFADDDSPYIIVNGWVLTRADVAGDGADNR